MTGPHEGFFSRAFAAARRRFVEACAAHGLETQFLPHPSKQAHESDLGTDVARIGPDEAAKVLVLLSGMHGPELMCGSACQTGLLESQHFIDLPDDTAVVFVHAINPWGAAHLRRNNEDNIDLARNFLNFSETLPVNAAYERVHPAFQPGAVASNAADSMAFLHRELTERGMPAVLDAVMGGQYRHADGFSFGGTEPAWSNRILARVLGEQCGQASQVVGLDFHSGLGPYGYGSAVVMHTGEALRRARRFFGGWVEAPREGSSTSHEEFYAVRGHTADGFMRALPGVEVTLATLEFGTYSTERNLKALIDDHWLSICGVGDETAVRQESLETHCPDDPEWRYAVWTRAQQAVRQALRCLTKD